MIPVNQEFQTDVENNIYGDCMRACIASLLHLPRREVPHFLDICQDKHNYIEFMQHVNEFLAKRNLYHLEVRYDWYMYQLKKYNHKSYNHHLIYGESPRRLKFAHAVVGLNGEIAHDPHPSKEGLVGEKEEWSIGLLIPTW